MSKLRLFPLCATLCVLSSAVFGVPAHAQSAAPAVCIVSRVDENHLVPLKGNVNPAANAANDRGPVSADLPMAGLTLVLSRSPEQQAAFDALVASQYDQSSPNFHQWLTPAEIGERFGPAQADVSTISGWLSSHGFAVKSLGADRMTIQFSGTAGQVQSAFHTEIHNLSVKGVPHIANMSDPQIPAALAPVVLGVKGLHNFLPHPLHKMGSKVQYAPDAHGWVKLQNSASASLVAGGVPVLTSAAGSKAALSFKPNNYTGPVSGSTAVEEDVAPYDFAAIYNLPSTWPTSTNGSGQTITIIGTSDIDLTDVSSFKTYFGLPTTGPTPKIVHGPDGDPGICTNSADACSPGDLDENSLDVEWSGAVAPSAQIVLVTDAYNNQTDPTNDPLYDGAQWAIDNAFVQGTAVYGSRILSLSYGQCELMNGTAANVAYYNLWQTAASAGFAVFVATGDSGSPSCDQGGDEIGNPYEAQYGLSVNGLGSTPFNTAVGGTDFSWCNPTLIQSGSNEGEVQGCSSSNASTYWNTSNNSQQGSAKGYVPETPWNDECLNPIWTAYFQSVAPLAGYTTPANPEAACNFIYKDWMAIANQDDFVMAWGIDTAGGSGGASGCVVSDGADASSCSSSTTSTGSSYGNLALTADGWQEPSWQTSTQSASLGVPQGGGRNLPDVSFFAGDGSLDSASLICVSNDYASCPSAYIQGGGAAVEVGGTSVATPAMAGVMALINQKAGAAQGSPNAELYTLAAAQPSPGTGTCSAERGAPSNCYFHDIDTGTNSMPCATTDRVVEGGVSYDPSSGEYEQTPQMYALASPNCNIVNGGDVIGTLSGYPAIAGYDQASGLGSLNIKNVVDAWPASTVSTGTASVSINLGGVTSIQTTQSLAVTVTVSGASGTPTGNVQLLANLDGTDSNYSSTEALSMGTYGFTIPANTFTAAGTATLTATFDGNSTYAPGGASTTVAITTSTPSNATFALGSITSPAAIAPGATASATATVSTSTGYVGTVSLSCALTTSPGGATALPSCSPNGTISLKSATSGSTTLSVTTTPVTTSSSEVRKPASGKGLLGAGSGAVLALLVFFGIPARRRSWRTMLGMVVLLVGLGSLAACGGGSGSGSGGTTYPGTTAGTYTFTVTATGNPTISTTQSTTFTVTVN